MSRRVLLPRTTSPSSIRMPSRRALLQGLAAGSGLAAVGGLPGPAWATTDVQRKFIFVTAFGGWDPTRVFASEFDNEMVAMESAATQAQVGDLSWVSHPDRPSVDAWFRDYGDRSVIVNGLVVPSVSHVTCAKLLFTGSSVAAAPDWPVRLAHASADRFALPQVVLAGPHYPQAYGPTVTRIRSGGAVEDLLRGDLLRTNDTDVGLPDPALRRLIDTHSRRRAILREARAATVAEAELAASFVTAQERASTLEGLVDEITWGQDDGLDSQVDVAVDLLRLGITRVVSLALADLTWDSHQDNDIKQSAMFEQLFTGLNYLQQRLDATPSNSGGTLGEETVVVVLSEMGRTPHLNGGFGKDHWSHTSVLIAGAGVAGGRTAGGYSPLYTGQPVDPISGEVSASGVQIDPDVLGATLLTLGGVDLDSDIADAEPLHFVRS